MSVEELSKLVEDVRSAFCERAMSSEFVRGATATLSDLGWSYDNKKFPELFATDQFRDDSGETPQNLAEALLWKIGRWKAYKSFASQFADEDAEPTNNGVVLYAFAKHLRDPTKNPIYDQHAIRAVWATCPMFTNDERESCKRLLFSGNDLWKASGSGPTSVECFNIFQKYLQEIESRGGADKQEIDQLLMPLGQAIKKVTTTYGDFSNLCGWENSRYG